MKSLYYLSILLLIVSCQSKPAKDSGKLVHVTDFYNRSITLEKNPKRIISASPVITEILFALKVNDRMVGRTDFCRFPPEVEKIPSIGGLEDPNTETMAELNPDLVIASEHFPRDMVNRLDQLKIKTIIFKNQESFEGTYGMIHQIAAIFGAEERGDSIIHSMKRKVEKVEKDIRNDPYHPSVYVVIGFGKTGEFTAGGNTFISQMITMAGGKNVAADMKGWAYSLEKLIEKDPDIIILRPGEKKTFCSSKNYQSLKAVQTGHVYEVDDNLFDITGPRLADGLETFYRIFHQDKNGR